MEEYTVFENFKERRVYAVFGTPGDRADCREHQLQQNRFRLDNKKIICKLSNDSDFSEWSVKCH